MTIQTPTPSPADDYIPRHRTLAKLAGRSVPGVDRVLTPDALLFLADLERRFGPTRRSLLADRELMQGRYDDGEMPVQPPETQHVRNGAWQIAPTPRALQDRRVEITGPVDRKMMINALNSGAKMFMADFEDASSPTFANMIAGQVNMMDYARNTLSMQTDRKSYALGDETATMLVRPRGWHLVEANVTVDGQPMSASLFDFGLHLFHNGKLLTESERGPFYYLPKIESYREARLWNDVFNFAQVAIGIPHATIKATVLIETLPAAFQMDEILHELQHHITGLNCGRWDYIFSYIKTLRNHKQFVLPDRAQVGMDRGFLKAYATRLVQTCHRRGAHAMGGMAAQIPVKNDPAANDAASEKVRADKAREVAMGHDGTWVAHPALVPIAMDAFSTMSGTHQIKKQRQNRNITDAGMLDPHTGTITEDGLRTNISVGIEYIAAWLGGRGAVPIHNLMEDAATAEISRAQIWQWLRHGAQIDMADGTSQRMSSGLFNTVYAEELEKLSDRTDLPRLQAAADIFRRTATSVDFIPFLTLPAYDILETNT